MAYMPCRTIELEEAPGGLTKVALYTPARQDEDGRFQWDDGQSVILAAWAGDLCYPLIPDTTIQLGKVDFITFVDGVSGQFHVLAEIVEGAEVRQLDFVCDPGEDQFQRRVVYEAEGLENVQTPVTNDRVPLGGYVEAFPAFTFGGETEAAFGDRRFAAKHELTEFAAVRVDLSMAWSQGALDRGPQIGDGRYDRLFLCGRTAGDEDWKIYELYWND